MTAANAATAAATRYISQKIAKCISKFIYPTALNVPVGAGNFAQMFNTGITRTTGLPNSEESIRLDLDFFYLLDCLHDNGT